jgi:hypothetical protein
MDIFQKANGKGEIAALIIFKNFCIKPGETFNYLGESGNKL